MRNAIAYEHNDYKGKSWELKPGSYDFDQVSASIGNDTISSVKVPAGTRVVFYEHAGFRGAQMIVTGDTPALPSFNDMVSSIKVFPPTPTGCKETATPGLFECPKRLQQVSTYRVTEQDPIVVIDGKSYYLRRAYTDKFPTSNVYLPPTNNPAFQMQPVQP